LALRADAAKRDARQRFPAHVRFGQRGKIGEVHGKVWHPLDHKCDMLPRTAARRNVIIAQSPIALYQELPAARFSGAIMAGGFE